MPGGCKFIAPGKGGLGFQGIEGIGGGYCPIGCAGGAGGGYCCATGIGGAGGLKRKEFKIMFSVSR